MDRFNPSRGSPLHQISFNRDLLPRHCSSKVTELPSSSSILDSICSANPRCRESGLITVNWTDSGSKSPEETMAYQQSWSMEPALNYALIPSQSSFEHIPNGLPRTVGSHDHALFDWSTSSMASNYSCSRQLKPESRRIPDYKGLSSSEWVQAPSLRTQSFYKSSHLLGSHQPPHSESSTASSYPPPSTTTTSTTNMLSSSSSPTLTSSPYHSSSLDRLYPSIKQEVDREDPGPNLDEADDANADPPYSQLIYEALRTAPGKKLPLQGIYGWFEKNTAKGKDGNSKGWQNSIRHNLSMNAGFEAIREESMPGKKAVNFWRLTDEAVNNGIQSTTRYRKQANYKKSMASDPPAPQRQRSGAKGGKATKITARFRGSMSQDELRRERYRQRIIPSQRHFQKNVYGQYLHPPTGTTTSTPSTYHAPGGPIVSAELFDLDHVVGCADPPSFFDMAGPGPDCLAFDAGFVGWDGMSSFPNGLFPGPEISTDLQKQPAPLYEKKALNGDGNTVMMNFKLLGHEKRHDIASPTGRVALGCPRGVDATFYSIEIADVTRVRRAYIAEE
ncbi:hypothetical protein P175DRAFT_0554338 [Aspergillus ochraceoroseus IBT 24754]|uniref:Fork-head domain-containing protein n=1 Tax=Aspergillus ochraceoroseus IBT 24754 TaxID=1392256 RepID=A0A2T5M974_9EURO|nr:uncharacterized protein P175DRAFT_0554338 [Aspergillus ochraceoroseus IBT 24754]PTU25088.1 hypothetical protein P175DRAFT_0554338 [Aspergillus ochraceoroseus IBT 24754]